MTENSIPFTMQLWQTGEYDTYMVNGLQVKGLFPRIVRGKKTILIGRHSLSAFWWNEKGISSLGSSYNLILIKRKQP